MAHDAADQTHWHEPKHGENAGTGTFNRRAMPYDLFMESEGVPIFRGIGVRRVQDLPMKPWQRLGGRGSYIQLYGTEGLWGMYIAEIPARGALLPEHHLYEKQVLVVEGRGATEVWLEGQSKKQTFEWQAGSLFSIPLNAHHRFINATSAPALILCGTSAPNIINLVDSMKFVFDCPWNFTERYSGADDYFKPKDDIAPDPVRGLAMKRTNLVPDVVNCEMPLDNRRSPGYRRMEPHMGGQRFHLWVGQHENGRYSKAHKHEVGSDPDLHQGQGLHVYVARDPGCDAVERRQGQQGAAPGLRAGRPRLGRTDERRLVPRPLRRLEGPAAVHGLVRSQQPLSDEARRARRGDG